MPLPQKCLGAVERVYRSDVTPLRNVDVPKVDKRTGHLGAFGRELVEHAEDLDVELLRLVEVTTQPEDAPQLVRDRGLRTPVSASRRKPLTSVPGSP